MLIVQIEEDNKQNQDKQQMETLRIGLKSIWEASKWKQAHQNHFYRIKDLLNLLHWCNIINNSNSRSKHSLNSLKTAESNKQTFKEGRKLASQQRNERVWKEIKIELGWIREIRLTNQIFDWDIKLKTIHSINSFKHRFRCAPSNSSNHLKHFEPVKRHLTRVVLLTNLNVFPK